MNISFDIKNLMLFVLFLGGHWVMGQNGQAPSPHLFDEKYKIIKHSIVHSDTGIFVLTNSAPINIKSIKGDTAFIEFKNHLKGKIKANSNKELLLKVDHAQPEMYLLLSEGNDKIRFTDYDISPLVIPIKIRPSVLTTPIQFTGDASIGPYFGYQFGSQSFGNQGEVTQTSVTISMFLTPSLIRINPTTGNDDPNNAENILGLSTGTGLLFDVNNYQFGIVYGMDWVSGTSSTTWAYQGKPWYSFSLAYNLTNK